jgi:hypothetical protein
MTRASQPRLQRRSAKRHESRASLPPAELQADAVQVPTGRFPHGVVAVRSLPRNGRRVRMATTTLSAIMEATLSDLAISASAHRSTDPIKRREARKASLLTVMRFFLRGCCVPADLLTPLVYTLLDYDNLDAGIVSPTMLPSKRKKGDPSSKRMAEAALSAAVDARYELSEIKNYERAAEQVVKDVDERLRRHSTRLNLAFVANIERVLPGQDGAAADVVCRVVKSRTKLAHSTEHDDDAHDGVLFYRCWLEMVKGSSEPDRPRKALKRVYAHLVRMSVEMVLQATDKPDLI